MREIVSCVTVNCRAVVQRGASSFWHSSKLANDHRTTMKRSSNGHQMTIQNNHQDGHQKIIKRSSKPSAQDHQPITNTIVITLHRTRNTELETRDTKPETQNTEHGTRNTGNRTQHTPQYTERGRRNTVDRTRNTKHGTQGL